MAKKKPEIQDAEFIAPQNSKQDALAPIEPSQRRGLALVGGYDYRQAFEQAERNLKALDEFVRSNFVEGVDFGPPFPGGDKPTLLQPGADKFDLLFNARPEYECLEVEKDLQTGYVFYRYRCRLLNKDSGSEISQGIGSCTSYESKYRYRVAERECPQCHQATIFRSKNEDENGDRGYFCWAKKGGCGANFSSKNPAIAQQEVGRVENTNLFDVWNTVDKMSQKRARVAAVISTGGVSARFTQDAEDAIENEAASPGKPRVAKQEVQSERKQQSEGGQRSRPKEGPDHNGLIAKISSLLGELRVLKYSGIGKDVADYARQFRLGDVNSTGDIVKNPDLSPGQVTQHLQGLLGVLQKKRDAIKASLVSDDSVEQKNSNKAVEDDVPLASEDLSGALRALSVLLEKELRPAGLYTTNREYLARVSEILGDNVTDLSKVNPKAASKINNTLSKELMAARKKGK